jgi:hypothetical protein
MKGLAMEAFRIVKVGNDWALQNSAGNIPGFISEDEALNYARANDILTYDPD